MNLKQLEREGFRGTDASLDVSLYEYGLIWNDEEFIYGIDLNNKGYYKTFSRCSVEGANIDESWIDVPGVCSFIGINEHQWNDEPVTAKVSALIDYYGYDNVFGFSYNVFEIENNLS